MKKLSLIVAIGKNNEIGKDNKLLWNIPEDLQFFKKVTTGKTIVMGSNTFYSIGRVLPNRHHLILTLDEYDFPKETEVFNNFDELLKRISKEENEVIIIGGAAIYSLFISYVDKMYITEIDKEYDADKFFPKFNRTEWNKEIISKEKFGDINYEHVLYIRKDKQYER